MSIRRTKEPSEIVVIFKTRLREGADVKEYARPSGRMRELVGQIPGLHLDQRLCRRGWRGDRHRAIPG